MQQKCVKCGNEFESEVFTKCDECFESPEAEIETTINADWLATEVAGIIYNQGKAKIFNVMESQLNPGPKLEAAKRVTQNIIAEIASNASKLIKEVLADWEEKVLVSVEGDLTKEEEEELSKIYKAIGEIIKK